MANPYHDFRAEPRSKHGYEALNDTLGGLGDVVAEHFRQQEANKDAIKLLMLRNQLEREKFASQEEYKNKNAINLENSKQQSAFDMEGKRFQRGMQWKQDYPDAFGLQPEDKQKMELKAKLDQQNQTSQSENQQSNELEKIQAQKDADFSMQGRQINRAQTMMGGKFNPVTGQGAAMSMPSGAVGDVNGNPLIQNPVSASAPQAKDNTMNGWEVNPNFMMTGKGSMYSKKADNSIQLQEKQDQFNQREWDKLTKEVNPLTTSGRNPLGMATKANYNANRALSTLSNPMVTNQEAGNVMADIASIYQNGSPTQFGMSEQAYHTVQAKLAGVMQYLTGKPQDALTPQIKNRLQNVLYDMKRTNFDVLRQNLDYTEKAKAKLIKAFPDEWKQMRETLLSDAYSGLGKQAGGGDMNTKIQKARDAGYSEEEIQKYLQGKM